MSMQKMHFQYNFSIEPLLRKVWYDFAPFAFGSIQALIQVIRYDGIILYNVVISYSVNFAMFGIQTLCLQILHKV